MSLLSDFLKLAAVVTGNPWLIALSIGSNLYDAKVARRRARRVFNDAQRDRLEMVDLQPDAPRTLVLGRVRYVEGVRRKWRTGVHSERLTMYVSVAGHQIDGFEQWYLDDTPVTLDGNGWVQTAPWFKARREQRSASALADGAGNATVTLPLSAGETLAATPAVAVWSTGSGESLTEGQASVSVAGVTATVTGAQPLAGVNVVYEVDTGTSLVRIRPYLGTDTQNVGADVGAEYGGIIDSRHAFKGIAGAVVDQIYDPDVFPTGRATVTAVFRGARCYDPRMDGTQPGGSGPHRVDNPATWTWSENPAVCALRYFLWPHGWAALPDEVVLADVAAAAGACDVATAFTLRKPDNTTEVVNLPRYRCGIAIASDADPRQMMDEIIESMAGRWGWAGGLWRLRAGVCKAPVFTLAQQWLAHRVDDNGEPRSDSVARWSSGVQRGQQINRVSGKCVDPAQRWQMLPFPRVQDAVLITARGAYQAEVQLEAVNHPAHAQHLGTITIREAQASLVGELSCSPAAWRCELLDVGTLDLPRYGFPAAAAKLVEVTGWRWHPDQGVRLQVQEISADIFTPVAELTGRDPAPNGVLRRPWDVEDVGALTVTSNLATLQDGSVVPRVRVQWPAPVSETLRVGGAIEIQYAPAGTTLPDDQWPSWPEEAMAQSTVIPGLLGGRHYVLRARFVQRQPFVRGNWTARALHLVTPRRATRVFRQAGEPVNGDVPGGLIDGDEWFDTDAGNRYYLRLGGTWAETSDGNKVTTFTQPTPPVAAAVGDLWLDSDDGNKLYRWNGTAWVPLPVGTGGLAPEATTTSGVQGPSTGASTWAPGPGDGGISSFVTVLTDAWTNDTDAAVRVEVSYSVSHAKTFVGASGNCSVVFALTGAATETVEKTTAVDEKDSAHVTQALVAPGQTLTMRLRIRRSTSEGSSVTVNYRDAVVRWAALKK